MSTEVRQLEPGEVWNKFADLNAVPRPSKKEERVIEFMTDFGKALGLETLKDTVGNVIIRKPATKGMEDRKTVTLQSHLDMVHQKNAETIFNFETEGIAMYVDGDWVRAKGTTLGADNGLGVAAIMALLESKAIPHPPLEALFTVDEETGMTGAMGLEAGVLQGEILLNLDTEEDDEIDIGCAGGLDVTADGNYKTMPAPDGYAAYQLTVKGLQGGHSGIDIHKGLGNANKIMNYLLYHSLLEFDIEIAEINGGGLRNAIPRESVATILIDKQAADALELEINRWAGEIQNDFSNTEPDLSITFQETAVASSVMEHDKKDSLLKSLYAAHNGVYAMSKTMPKLVETSNNIARVVVSEGKIKIGCLTRSSVESSKMDLAQSLRSVFELAGYKVTFSGSYPGWEPKPNSPILEIVVAQYEKLFNDKPAVVACHAGLECGILGQNYPDLDMISFGPTIKGAHSPDERVSIASVKKFWTFLIAILKEIPKS